MVVTIAELMEGAGGAQVASATSGRVVGKPGVGAGEIGPAPTAVVGALVHVG